MCKNLVEKGELSKPLIIFNRTEKRAQDLSNSLPAGKSTVAISISDAVSKSDIIFTCLGDDNAILETLDTALQEDVNGKLFVDCSTIHPETSEGLAKKITDAGAEFLASPVFGAPAMADSGQCEWYSLIITCLSYMIQNLLTTNSQSDLRPSRPTRKRRESKTLYQRRNGPSHHRSRQPTRHQSSAAQNHWEHIHSQYGRSYL